MTKSQLKGETGPAPHLTYWSMVQDTFSTFWLETSIAGISNTSRAKSRVCRGFWLLLFSVGIFLTFMDVTAVFESYFTYPYNTKVRGMIFCLLQY